MDFAVAMAEYRSAAHKTILKKQKSLPLSKNKNVHFADVCGLSLVSVHQISMDDLTILPSNSSLKNEVTQELVLTFPQPSASDNFLERLNRLNISLENVLVSNCAIMGTVKVKNLAFEKHVFRALYFDQWRTHEDHMGSYVPLSHDGNFDRFSFAIAVPVTMKKGDRMEFAICYRTVSPLTEWWDNNDGKNYVIEYRQKIVSKSPSYSLLWSELIPNFRR